MCYELALIVKKRNQIFPISSNTRNTSDLNAWSFEGLLGDLLQSFLCQLLCPTSIRIDGFMQHTWHTCRAPSAWAELMLNTCCVSSDILISVRIRSSHSTSQNCFNMQFNWPNRQVDLTFMLCLGMLKHLTDVWQCWKLNKDCMSFLKYSSLPTAPAADYWIHLCCVLRTPTKGFRNSDSAFTDFTIVKGTLAGVQSNCQV